tara:strand:- start:69 stop:1607 length:1539 start_codon:yes stop_codon:yes gene_type:complete
MTASNALLSLSDLVSDLTQSMPRETRFQRLLEVFQRNFPCDAIALLECDGGKLIPRAVAGLSSDTLGRRFVVQDNPRLAQILDCRHPVRFAADSDLPDPYDGLVDTSDKQLYVHDCLGAALYIEDKPWGVITLDALKPGSFDTINMTVLEAFLGVASATVRAADWIRQLETRLKRRQDIQLTSASSGEVQEMIGDSRLMAQLKHEASVVAASELTVLILGETGVGKELIAQYIHRNSSRASEPMIYVNCAALPESIAESELFGHVKGAFSGAIDNRTGKFELADSGTLFLDEIGELPLSIQAKLLRALQDGNIQRVGSDDHHIVDTRFIAATNRNLKQEVADGRFRADLYHRLSVYPLVVPPLRDRSEDIIALAGYFLERNKRRLGLAGVRLSPSARNWLKNSPWPGNIRELEHTLSRGIIRALSSDQAHESIIELQINHLGFIASTSTEQHSEAGQKLEPEPSLKDALDEYQRDLVASRLHTYDQNKAATARSLGLDRGNFSRLLKRLDLP